MVLSSTLLTADSGADSLGGLWRCLDAWCEGQAFIPHVSVPDAPTKLVQRGCRDETTSALRTAQGRGAEAPLPSARGQVELQNRLGGSTGGDTDVASRSDSRGHGRRPTGSPGQRLSDLRPRQRSDFRCRPPESHLRSATHTGRQVRRSELAALALAVPALRARDLRPDTVLTRSEPNHAATTAGRPLLQRAWPAPAGSG